MTSSLHQNLSSIYTWILTLRIKTQWYLPIFLLKLKKKSVSDMSGDKVASAQIPVDQSPTPSVWFQNHQIWGFQTKLTFDLNSIFEKFQIKIKFENCCILKERKNCSMTLCWHLNWKSFKCFRIGSWLPILPFLQDLDLIKSEIRFGISSRPQ
mgnify:CR=1 FL=1